MDASVGDEKQELAASGARFAIVGLGASAGGLGPLQQLFGALPADTGMAFVVIQHLSPERDSGLAEILSRATAMPVCEVQDQPVVEPNHVYIIPPGRDMVIVDNKLQLLAQERWPLHRGIDQFFRSLAENSGHLAIGVVLSGCASDGTLGLEEIKAAGGCTFAQDDTAQHESMPRNAIASGCVDMVLPPEGIARELARIARHPYVAAEEDEHEEAEPPGHSRVVEMVRRAVGVDFSHYKANTLRRRITRRMMLHRLETTREYEEYLRRTPAEVQALYQDILIGVTSFFRNPEAFEVLACEVFPKLITACQPGEPVRFWSAGCATGEEAYSLAVAFTECADAMGSSARLQLFGTDVNSAAIEKARTGLYPRNIANDVSSERLQRFFSEEGGGYRIRKTIRERCVFSRHNLLSDPPFSRVDFIACRNLLIYLEPALQQRIIPLFHYALKPGGWLWLGSSESVGLARATLFDIIEARQKIFARRPGGRTPAMRAQQAPAGHFRLEVSGARPVAHGGLPRDAERLLLAKYAPPGVIVSAELEIVQFQGDTNLYLAPTSGAASHDLFKMLREGLPAGVRDAIQRAAKEGEMVRTEGLRVRSHGGFLTVTVEVIPIKSDAPGKGGGFIVLFDSGPKPSTKTIPRGSRLAGWWRKFFGMGGASAMFNSREEEILHLTRELATARETLQATIEQSEAAHEELQSANEEAQSANEEMQSVNEELETSKEEIEASNEELTVLMDELTSRNSDLNRLNDELRISRDYAESIIASVRVPLMVLDAELRVKTASHAFYERFQVTPSETEGRLVYDLGDGQWDIPLLRKLLEEVLPLKNEVNGFEVRHTFEQIGPRIMFLSARRLEQAGSGEPLLALSIEDVTDRTLAAEKLQENKELLDRQAEALLSADRSKDEFLAMLAHELRNPLAPLRSAAELLETSLASESERAQAQSILSRQINNMSRMIDDLLDISRITEGKIELHRQCVDLADILRNAVNVARPDCSAQGQELTVSLPPEPIYVEADATRLDQIFGNLLSNASKYGGEGCHITLSAELSPGEVPTEVVVKVRDDGVGITPDLLPRIFDLFVQASRTLDRAHGGLGIGLTLVSRLVKLHGGIVKARSDGPGRGAEFLVRLPTVSGAPSPPPQRSGSSQAETPCRMLVVDDNQDSANIIAMVQRHHGHTTRVAFTGPEALAVAAEFQPEVVLLDIGLPGMDGFEVARRLRAMPALAGVFLVAMTGYGRKQDRTLALAAGFDRHLVKPLTPELLDDCLRSRSKGKNCL